MPALDRVVLVTPAKVDSTPLLPVVSLVRVVSQVVEAEGRVRGIRMPLRLYRRCLPVRSIHFRTWPGTPVKEIRQMWPITSR